MIKYSIVVCCYDKILVNVAAYVIVVRCVCVCVVCVWCVCAVCVWCVWCVVCVSECDREALIMSRMSWPSMGCRAMDK